MNRIKTILVSQPEPDSKSPYYELAKKNDLKIEFRPFIKVEPVSAKEFRQSRISLQEHTAVVFTSRTAIDHYFDVCSKMRFTVPDTMKYFCVSETTAFYLQKHIVYRKRKIFHAPKFPDLLKDMGRHKNEKFLVPLSEQHKPDIIAQLKKTKLDFTKAILYRTVCDDLSDLTDVNYDMLVFYSPSGIKSLKQNFPDFQQNGIRIASFGPATCKAVEDAGLRCDVKAPMPEAPSMTMAIEQFIKNQSEA